MGYVVCAVLIVAAFVAGFFVGKKHGVTFDEVEQRLRAILGK